VSAASAAAVRPLTARERQAVTAAAIGTGVLGLLGFANSFARVNEAAAGSFGWWAWTVPLGIDLGIAVFAGLELVLARLDMRARWLRLIPWTLIAVTVYLNVAKETDAFGVIAHAALPGLWVVAVEVAAHVIRLRVGLACGTRMERIRHSRWLLAPVATAALWRRMVLWEIRSYPEALRRERARLLALTELQDTYGRMAWRWRAPRRARALYRLGELAPMTDPSPAVRRTEAAHGAPELVKPPPSTPALPQARPSRAQIPGAGQVRRTGRRTPEQLRAAAAAYLAEHPDASARRLSEAIGTRWKTANALLADLRPTAVEADEANHKPDDGKAEDVA
jgi:hypothetical protein